MCMIYFILNSEHLQFSSLREEIAERLNLTEAKVQVSKSLKSTILKQLRFCPGYSEVGVFCCLSMFNK